MNANHPSRNLIRVVALDIDGTLAGSDHRVSTRSINVLTALQNAGVAPVIVTGRTEKAALSIAREAGLSAPVISCNGAIVSVQDAPERIREAVFGTPVILDLIDWAGTQDDLELILWTPGGMLAEKQTQATQLLQDINLEDVTVASFGHGVPNVVKVMVGGSTDSLDANAKVLTRAFPFLHRSLDNFFEGSPLGASKWESLQQVLASMRVDPASCLGIADGDTDIEWMSKIGHAIAVENARPSVLAIAEQVIGHHADDAVALFLQNRFNLHV